MELLKAVWEIKGLCDETWDYLKVFNGMWLYSEDLTFQIIYDSLYFLVFVLYFLFACVHSLSSVSLGTMFTSLIFVYPAQFIGICCHPTEIPRYLFSISKNVKTLQFFLTVWSLRIISFKLPSYLFFYSAVFWI